jgi:cell division protein FtsW (lipid II flippase)
MVTGPSRQPTPAEYFVIFLLITVSLVAIGVIALVAASRATPEKHDVSVQLVRLGICSLGLGVGIIVVYWIYRRCKDYDS